MSSEFSIFFSQFLECFSSKLTTLGVSDDDVGLMRLKLHIFKKKNRTNRGMNAQPKMFLSSSFNAGGK